jgi:hypothetical protein
MSYWNIFYFHGEVTFAIRGLQNLGQIKAFCIKPRSRYGSQLYQSPAMNGGLGFYGLIWKAISFSCLLFKQGISRTCSYTDLHRMTNKKALIIYSTQDPDRTTAIWIFMLSSSMAILIFLSRMLVHCQITLSWSTNNTLVVMQKIWCFEATQIPIWPNFHLDRIDLFSETNIFWDIISLILC